MGNILFPGNCLSVFPEIVFVFANLFPPVFQLFSILIKIEMSVFINIKISKLINNRKNWWLN